MLRDPDIVPSTLIAPDAVDPTHLLEQLRWKYASQARHEELESRWAHSFDAEGLDELLGLVPRDDSPFFRSSRSGRDRSVASGVR